MVAREKADTMITLSDKRLLSIDEFGIYASLGLCKAREIAEETGSLFKVGKRVLVYHLLFIYTFCTLCVIL